MTGSREALKTELQGSADAVLGVVQQILDALKDSPGASLDGSKVDILRQSFSAVERLSEQLSVAAGVLVALQSHAGWEKRFGHAFWAQRSAELTQKLEVDPDAGTTQWLEAFVDALTAGASEEASRLLAEGFKLADWAPWLPDRCAAVQDAVSVASVDGARSAVRLTDLIDLLSPTTDTSVTLLAATVAEPSTRDRLANITPGARIRILLLAVRILALADDPRATLLISIAKGLLPFAAPADEATHLRSITAAESFVERHGLPSGRRPVAWTEAMRGAAPSDLASLHEYIARSRSPLPDASDPPDHRAKSDAAAASTPNLMTEVTEFVNSLPDVAGIAARLGVLIETPSEELTVALAARLCREEQFATAELLLESFTYYSESRQLQVSQLKLDIVRSRASTPEELAAANTNVGDFALWGREFDLAQERYKESLALRPDHPDTLRSLADVLQASTPQYEPKVAQDNLRRAIELCAQAAELDPIVGDTSWALLVERAAHVTLSAFVSEDRGAHLWRAIALTAKAVSLQPDQTDRWSTLAVDLLNAGVYECADLAASQYRRLSSDDDDSRELVALTALNVGRFNVGLTLLPDDPDKAAAADRDPGDTAWTHALLAHALWQAGNAPRAVEHFVRAQELSPQLQYRQWLAELRTERDDPEANRDWRSLWRDSDIDTLDGLDAAAWAATYQGLTTSSRELANRLEPLERLVAGARTSLLVRGIARVWDRGSDADAGWDDLKAAYDWMTVPEEITQTTDLVRAMTLRTPVDDPHPLADRVSRLGEDRLAEVSQLVERQAGKPVHLTELDWFARRLDDHVVPPALAAVREAMDLAMRGEAVDREPDEGTAETDVVQPEASSGDGDQAAQEETIKVALPPSWFTALEGREETHEFFLRSLPDARAAARRVSAAESVDQPVRVRVEPDCEPDQVWVGSPGLTVPVATVVDGQWYCPRTWLLGLTPDRRSAATPSSVPGLLAVPPPVDAIARLGSWSSAETVARVVLNVTVDHDVEQEPWPYLA
jgi:tetratricopeptide (TPR) repeat protein